ncbi:MAG: S-layer protein [Bacteroidetes bacterium]|nr:MAG: S-layer protein [Bacteroidota bacterium]
MRNLLSMNPLAGKLIHPLSALQSPGGLRSRLLRGPALVLLGLLLASACERNTPLPDPEPRPDPPPVEDPRDSLKPRYLWFDASANFRRFSYYDSIVFYLAKAKEVGISDIVVDVRPVCGDVLYKSALVDELIDWNGYHREIDYDYLEAFITEGKKLNLRVHAALNVFSGGHNYFDAGVVYRDPDMAARTTLLNKPEGFVDIKTIKSKYSAFFNPADPLVQKYCLDIIRELAANYDVDGIILDRCRFDGIDSDFSQTSRDLFENYIGQKLSAFPDDIFKWVIVADGSWGRHPGAWYITWLEWRAKVIHDFFAEARAAIQEINPEIAFGTYTGAWYPTYYFVGANWASKNYDPRSDSFENWMFSPKYKDFAYADLLDIYMTGVYYATLYGSGWYTIEGGLANAKRVTMGDVGVNGSLYVHIHKDRPGELAEAVKLCLTDSDGVMVFDIVHLISHGLWDELKEGIQKGLEANAAS